jgi:hypothetical protein
VISIGGRPTPHLPPIHAGANVLKDRPYTRLKLLSKGPAHLRPCSTRGWP